MADVSKMIADGAAWVKDHLDRYMADGKAGHLLDTSHLGGPVDTTTLVLKTTGRRSGQTFLTPLIYIGVDGGYAIIASKGGADEHPAWFLNLTAKPEVRFQVADQVFDGRWRIVEDAERAAIWAKAVAYYPPYAGYQEITAREIPVIVLSTDREVGTSLAAERPV